MRRIFYYCYDHNRPTGGEKHSYQHVDLLNRNGFEAYAYHRASGLRLSWFQNDTAVVDSAGFGELYDHDRDIIVFPEDLGPDMLRYPGRRVIFDKNVFHGFQALRFGQSDPFSDPATIALLAVSEHNVAYLRQSYPGKPIYRVYAHIKSELFVPKPFDRKSRRIVTPAKAAPMVTTLYRMLKNHSMAAFSAGWEWVVLSGKTESEAATILGDSPILVFCSVEEGLPRLPLEAMCCNCLVAAFRSGPLLEILPPGQGFQYGDLLAMLHWIEDVIASFPHGASTYSDILTAQRAIALQFSEEKQTISVCAAWETILRSL